MKKFFTLALAVSMMASLAVNASALEYSIDAPNDYDFGKDTSIEVIHTADGGAMRNEDVSKNHYTNLDDDGKSGTIAVTTEPQNIPLKVAVRWLLSL